MQPQIPLLPADHLLLHSVTLCCCLLFHHVLAGLKVAHSVCVFPSCMCVSLSVCFLCWTCAVCQIPHWVGWRSNHTLHSLSVSQRGDNSNYSNTHIHMPILTVIILINKLVSSQDQCIWRKRPEKSGTESDGKITWPHVALNGGIAPWTNITPRYKEINKAQLRSCLLAKVTN